MRSALVLAAVVATAHVGLAATLDVGPGKPFARVEQAIARAAPGDTILIHPQEADKPYDKPALYITKPRLTIKSAAAAGQRIALNGESFDYSGRGSIPRAIIQFNRSADGCSVEGLDLSGAHNASHNGAGIRINQANDITIRNCRIHGNDMGIMSNGDGTSASARNQLIEDCLIHSNGSRKDPGFNHNLYLGGTSVRLLGCEVHSSLTGHNVKSRAHHTSVIACYIHDSANRELDLVDARGDTTAPGSDAVLFGNIIAKDPKCSGNRAVIHFGQDGGNEHDGTIWLAHNTIVTPFVSPVLTLSAPKTRAQLLNNIVWDSGGRQAGQKLVDIGKSQAGKAAVQGAGNWLSSGFAGAGLDALGLARTSLGKPGVSPPFVAPAKGDWRLAGADLSVAGAVGPLPDGLRQAIGESLWQYRHPATKSPRPGLRAAGAYEAAP